MLAADLFLVELQEKTVRERNIITTILYILLV
jgi:hypothetical protein